MQVLLMKLLMSCKANRTSLLRRLAVVDWLLAFFEVLFYSAILYKQARTQEATAPPLH